MTTYRLNCLSFGPGAVPIQIEQELKMSTIHVYTKNYCAYCRRAKQLLTIKGVPFTEFDVTDNPALEIEMRRRSGRATVPQIFVGERHIGGCDDLFALDELGELDPLLVQIS